MTRLAGKVAVVTGAASGIGAAIVRRFLGEGANVIATDIAPFDEAASQGVITLHHDAAIEADWERVIAVATERHGRLDVLVNNAGVPPRALVPITETPLEDWRRVLDIDLGGVFLGLKHGMRAMTGGGAIVNMGSVHSFVGTCDAASYCAAKGGLLMLTRAAALEGARLAPPVRVNSVHPGYVATPRVRDRVATAPGYGARLIGRTPLGRLAEMGEIASCVVHLASDESSYVTGAALRVDGGYSAG